MAGKPSEIDSSCLGVSGIELPAKVYAVDSSADELARLVETLHNAGLEVVGLSSAEELLEQFENGRAICVVTELELPGLGGLELQLRLRSISAHTTFVFFTRSPDVSSAVAALRGGASDYLEKFWLGSEVIKRVRIALEESRRRLEESRSLGATQRRQNKGH